MTFAVEEHCNKTHIRGSKNVRKKEVEECPQFVEIIL
jgi:hypothetical protein